MTGGKRSLDDFCKRFHGAPSTLPMVKTYVFDDVVAMLNDVAPFDWRNFLLTRFKPMLSLCLSVSPSPK